MKLHLRATGCHLSHGITPCHGVTYHPISVNTTSLKDRYSICLP